VSDILPAWTAIADWLAGHAPASHATLRPGASVADVRSAEVAVTDYSLSPWGGLAIDAQGRLAPFSQDSGEPPSAPLTSPGYGSLSEFLDSVTEALTQGTGPLMSEATPGIHRGALVWGPLPGDGAPWTAMHPEHGSIG